MTASVSKGWCQTHGPQDEWKNDCIEFIIFFGQPPMITPSINHIQDSHGILSRFPLKGEERRIFLLLKWSYHSGCRLAWKVWQLQPAEAPSGLAVSSAVNDRQAGQPCYSAILLLITQSGMNLFAYLFMDIMPFLCVKVKLNNFDRFIGTAMKKIYDIHVQYFVPPQPLTILQAVCSVIILIISHCTGVLCSQVYLCIKSKIINSGKFI